MATARLEATAATTPPHTQRTRIGAARAIQVHQDDADDQGGFDTFTQSDQK